ncbi:HAMP domain-containing protein [Nitrogeniibacter mangrovi]|uniref:HAMP domain-containing protein n=1 Tax=Nitrogeniibacter mangrovi TaxID=2016596 RepID=A0A6C1B1Y2_9RHOO|nr:histidine kinase [Nitrogeniibacter mangrovi]QID17373.1 HAMP domain-containing protein [Nitrogeniibacter mangrovi]
MWRGWGDVRQEGLGAGQVAELTRRLAQLREVPTDGVEAELATLRALVAGGRLRHLGVEIADPASGEVLVRSSPATGSGVIDWLRGHLAPHGRPPTTRWTVERPDGRQFDVTLTASPDSEQREALGNIAGVVGVMVLYSVALLAGMYWAVRHAFAPLRQIVATIGAFGRQRYDARLPDRGVRELDVISHALNHLAQSLARVEGERRDLSLKVLTLQEDERARIARELHDEFGQVLTAMRADLTFLQRSLPAGSDVLAVAAALEAQCVGIQQGVRGLLGWLSAPGLEGGRGGRREGARLGEMIRALVDNWALRPGQDTDYHLDLRLSGELPQALALSLYRMTQEALTNVARHAQAGRVDIQLDGDASAEVRWSVSDDGVGRGADDEGALSGNGLAGIRERVWAHGGRLHMGPGRDGRGWTLAASFPAPEVVA